jgi:hypothetical protein
MKLPYLLVGYMLVFLSIYITCTGLFSLWTYSSDLNRGIVVIFQRQQILLVIPGVLLFGAGIFCIQKSLSSRIGKNKS